MISTKLTFKKRNTLINNSKGCLVSSVRIIFLCFERRTTNLTYLVVVFKQCSSTLKKGSAFASKCRYSCRKEKVVIDYKEDFGSRLLETRPEIKYFKDSSGVNFRNAKHRV